MKRLLSTTILLTILTAQCMSQRAVNKFIDNNKNQQECVAMTLPGWLIRSGMNFAEKFAEEDDQKAYLALGQYINKIRFMAIEENSKVKSEDVDWLIRSLAKESMDEFVKIKSEEGNVNVWIKEKKDIVQNLTVLARGDDSFILVTMNTDMPIQALKEANLSFNSNKQTIH